MLNTLYTIIYSLGGADYNIIKHLTVDDSKKPYRHLGWSVILCTLVAFISGADVTHQYTTVVPITVAGALFFSALVFSFDYFLINSNSSNTFFKLLRIPVAAANVILGTLALMVMLCQSKIDNKILLANSGNIIKCDTTYQAEKEARYKQYNVKADEVKQYHTTVCYPEAKNGYAGFNYQRKHKYCVTQDSLLAIEKVSLDSAEVAFFTTYENERSALEKVTSNDFFEKCVYLPEIFKTNWVTLIFSICGFVIAFYVETQSLIMKFSMNPDDEYHQALAQHKENCKEYTNQRLKRMQEHNERMNGYNTDKSYHADVSKWANDMLNQTLSKTALSYKLNEYKRILRENGLSELSDEIASIQNAVSNGSDTDKLMQNLIDKINRN